MTNKEAVEILREHDCNYCGACIKAEAIDFAIKAIHIVGSIDLSFENNSKLMVDIDDWNNIKAIIDKYNI